MIPFLKADSHFASSTQAEKKLTLHTERKNRLKLSFKTTAQVYLEILACLIRHSIRGLIQAS